MRKLIGIILCFWVICISAKELPMPTAIAFDPHVDMLSSYAVLSIVDYFSMLHVQPKRIDNRLSMQLYHHYLDGLDPDHMIFLQKDVNDLGRYAYELDDALLSGNTHFAFRAFNLYLRRKYEQLQLLESIIDSNSAWPRLKSLENSRSGQAYPMNNEEKRWLLVQKLSTLYYSKSNHNQQMDSFAKQITESYTNQYKYVVSLRADQVISAYINAWLSINDPHSRYLSRGEFDSFLIQIGSSVEGIGIGMRVKNGYPTITKIVEGGPVAQEGSILVHDRIVAVAQQGGAFVSVVNMKLDDVVKLIRGESGTKIYLRIMRKNMRGYKTVDITRDHVKLKDRAASLITIPVKVRKRFISQVDNRIVRLAVIRLPLFYANVSDTQSASAPDDIQKILDMIKKDKVAGVVLDLRKNAGGGLSEAIDVSGLFVGKNPIVAIHAGDTILYHSNKSLSYTGPLVVLVDGMSASASEILVGAMKDYKRAIIVGRKQTFGKGSVQNLIELPNNLGALKVTSSLFYRISGKSPQYYGVKPDVVLQAAITSKGIPTERDFPYALKPRAIRPFEYSSYGAISDTLLDAVVACSAQRQGILNQPSIEQHLSPQIGPLNNKGAMLKGWQSDTDLVEALHVLTNMLQFKGSLPEKYDTQAFIDTCKQAPFDIVQ